MLTPKLNAETKVRLQDFFTPMRVLGALIFGALAQESDEWSDWTEWSACEKGVYKRVRRCHNMQDGRAFNRVANDACGGHYQVNKKIQKLSPHT